MSSLGRRLNVESLRWSIDLEILFIDIMYDEVIRGNLLGSTFTPTVWTDIQRRLNAHCTQEYSVKQLREKLSRIKTNWRKYKKLMLFDTGLGWDHERDVPRVDDNWWNLYLEVLIIYHDVSVPLEIWEMSQLRYLDMKDFSLPDPPNVPLIHDEDDDHFILRNLQTIKNIRNFKLSEEMIKRIPIIKKLGLFYDVNRDDEWWHNYCLNNLGLLNKLESLSIRLSTGYKWSRQIDFVLPHSLKKLSFESTEHLREEDMRMIGSLAHLQVLKLKVKSVCGPEWNPIEGEFLFLKSLLIKGCFELVYWNANRNHFPCLEQLVLCHLNNLKEIPCDIGHIPTLQLILLEFCSDSLVKSAKDLLDEQVELGNEDLQVRVTCWDRTQFNQLKSLRSHNFQVKSF